MGSSNFNQTLLVMIIVLAFPTHEALKTISVIDYGAKGDRVTDDTKAFDNAWKAACSWTQEVALIVPKGKTYLAKQLRFKGPCKTKITLEIGGTVLASNKMSDYEDYRSHWILIDSVDNLMVEGGGTIHGNGDIWWQNSCKRDKSKPCRKAPTAMTLYKCTNLKLRNLKFQNAQQIHVSFSECSGVEVSNIAVVAPESSPNTDGIHVTATRNIQISGCRIATGDDCISIVDGSENVRASDITCGPGHGISIGSLGEGNSENYVSDVIVNGAKLYGSTNGVRIKTWQGGSGSASNIQFNNIEMKNVKNLIIIDQNYCDQEESCPKQVSAVQVKNVVYNNINGTSASKAGIVFNCSKSHPCQGIQLRNLQLNSKNGGDSEATCVNVKPSYLGVVSPRCP